MKRQVIFAAFFLCLWPAAGDGYMRFRTEQITLNPTPGAVGTESGRLCLTVKNGGEAGGASVFCGPCEIDPSEYWELVPGEQYTWGANYKEQFSAQIKACCYSESGDQLLYLSEEGLLLDLTRTPTETPTPTETATPTETPTNTP